MTTGLTLEDLLRLRTPLATCAALLLLVMSLASAAHVRLLQAREARLLSERDLGAVQQQLTGIRADQGDRLARLQRYGEIVRRQGAGEERPMQWLGVLRRSAAQHHVSALETDFAPSIRIEPGGPGQPQLRATRMKLRMELMHEEAFLGLFADLRERTRAYLHLRSCSLERIADAEGAHQGFAPALRAECSIDWLSLHEAP